MGRRFALMSSPPHRSIPARVASAAEAAAWDRATIDGGVPSRALMQRAGAAAASEIHRRFRHRLGRGVAIFAGPGNNGGDAWVVGRALAAAGVQVRVSELEPPRTDDARAERELALRVLGTEPPTGAEEIVIDGVLGTGVRGAPRGEAAEAIARINALRDGGATVIALDVPSGLDASSGSCELAVLADLTLTFGAAKRGLLVARGQCGTIAVLDIGLDAEEGAALPELVDHRWVAARVPAIAPEAHKGVRKKLAVVGGSLGMAGASIFAGRAAMVSGIGMVRLVVPSESVTVVQKAAPELMAREWPAAIGDVASSVADWADVVLIGPGLGRSRETRELVEQVLRGFGGPVVLDADALNVFERDAPALASALGRRDSILTPHPMELARLLGADVQAVLDRRFEIAEEAARMLHATVLLKGVPTVIAAASGARLVSAAGSPALGVAGSGDLLGGMAATLLAQASDPLAAAACAAWVHGRAGEIASQMHGAGGVRGVTIEHLLEAIGAAWRVHDVPPCYPVILELTAPGAWERELA